MGKGDLFEINLQTGIWPKCDKYLQRAARREGFVISLHGVTVGYATAAYYSLRTGGLYVPLASTTKGAQATSFLDWVIRELR